MNKRLFLTIAFILIIIILAGIAIFLAKGYTFSPKERRIVGTGIITVSSEPDSASVYIDGHLTTATNATISSLSPKSYTVKVIKEGFIPWERSVEVKEGLVTELKLTLFPAIPTIYPLTFTGVSSPILSPDSSKLAYIVITGKKPGVWVWTMSKNQPIFFARSSEPHQIASNTIADFSKAVLKWSPDSKQVLATVGPDKIGVGKSGLAVQNNYLLNSDSLNSEPRDITPTLEPTMKGWEDDTKLKDVARIDSIKDTKYRKIASDSARLALVSQRSGPEAERASLSWAPDETKFMIKTDKETKVYDLEEGKEYTIPVAKATLWLPDSKHIILVEDNTISLIDIDGTNKAVIYAGSFKDNFVFPWPDSSRLVIISSFPTPTASEPNLYGINLR